MKPPDLPQEIWLEIFQFATHVHQHTTVVPLDPFTPRRVSSNVMGPNTPSVSIRTKLSLVLVCRSWRRLALQLLYSYLCIRSPARATSILIALGSRSLDVHEKGNSYGYCTRHIEVHTHARGAGDLSFLQTLFKIFKACPNLRTLSANWNHHLPIEFLDAISKLHGPSLCGLYWNDHISTPKKGAVAFSRFLGSYTALRALDLRNYGGPVHTASAVTLPAVQDLVISTTLTSLSVATALCLPTLHNLTIRTHPENIEPNDLLTDFLHVHGNSLLSVDVHSPSTDADFEHHTSQHRRVICQINPDIFLLDNRCPNLLTLCFPTTSPTLSPNIDHPLRRIGLRGVRAETLYPDKNTSTVNHLMSLTPSSYPKLEVIRTIDFLVEADTDVLIKDVFVWWVERFEKQGIDFLDGEGVLWKYDCS